MFIIDTYTIIVSAMLLSVALLTSFINPFFRRPKLSEPYCKEVAEEALTEETETIEQREVVVEEKQYPPVSIILTPNDDALALSKNLNKYLNQDYPNYEIIVVVPKGDAETEDILKTHAGNSRLYTTFIPSTSKYMSRKKLAIIDANINNLSCTEKNNVADSISNRLLQVR